MKGSSPANWVSFMGGPPTDYTYPRVVEREILAGGRNVTVRNLAATSERAKTGLRNWERQVFSWSPDVVVLHYGLFEAVHLFLPQRLERHANSQRSMPGPVRSAYRKLALRPTWKGLAIAQQQLDAKVPAAVFRRRAARFADDLDRLVGQIQRIGSPLVLLPEVAEPGERWATWFPHIDQRIAMVNDALVDVVRRHDRDNVRVFPTRTVLAPLTATGHDVVPDGGHFTPQAHEVIGTAMAAEIRDFCETNVPL